MPKAPSLSPTKGWQPGLLLRRSPDLVLGIVVGGGEDGPILSSDFVVAISPSVSHPLAELLAAITS